MSKNNNAEAGMAAQASRPVITDKDLTEFCLQLSDVLIRAGRNKASCMVPSNGPVISFAEWTERAIRKHIVGPKVT